mmetsp:Transcript_5253/g.14903  ORF Transcript_5253/g.14903 Transcript_5253/m.14903 type:complete len:223 (+) Transcript_5253:738-1406(+)
MRGTLSESLRRPRMVGRAMCAMQSSLQARSSSVVEPATTMCASRVTKLAVLGRLLTRRAEEDRLKVPTHRFSTHRFCIFNCLCREEVCALHEPSPSIETSRCSLIRPILPARAAHQRMRRVPRRAVYFPAPLPGHGRHCCQEVQRALRPTRGSRQRHPTAHAAWLARLVRGTDDRLWFRLPWRWVLTALQLEVGRPAWRLSLTHCPLVGVQLTCRQENRLHP